MADTIKLDIRLNDAGMAELYCVDTGQKVEGVRTLDIRCRAKEPLIVTAECLCFRTDGRPKTYAGGPQGVR